MNGKYTISINSDFSQTGFEQITVDKDPASEPWDDVRGVLENEFIRIGNLVVNTKSIITISYYEEALNVA